MGYIQHKSEESVEDYLETILVLSKRLPVVRSIDIANELEYSKPSVSVAMKNLKGRGYITVSSEGYIVLTEEGHPVRGICLPPGSVTGSRGTAGSRYIFAAVLIVPI